MEPIDVDHLLSVYLTDHRGMFGSYNAFTGETSSQFDGDFIVLKQQNMPTALINGRAHMAKTYELNELEIKNTRELAEYILTNYDWISWYTYDAEKNIARFYAGTFDELFQHA